MYKKLFREIRKSYPEVSRTCSSMRVSARNSLALLQEHTGLITLNTSNFQKSSLEKQFLDIKS